MTLSMVGTIASSASPQPASSAERPFGTLREQAALQQEWLRKRLDTFLPALMRKHGIDLWLALDAGGQRGPRVPGHHLARDLRRKTTNDLRLLR